MKSRPFVKLQLVSLLSLAVLITTCAARPAKPAHTIYYNNKTPDAAGHYNFEFQTTNGITTKAAGNEHGAVGVVQYVSKEGVPVTFTYIADKYGYQPGGDHEQPHLARQLEYIITHPRVDEPKSRRL